MVYQMVCQNLYANEDEYYAAGNLRLFLEAISKTISDPDAKK